MRIEIPSYPCIFGSKERISLIIILVSILKSEGLVTFSNIWLLERELSRLIYDRSTVFSEKVIE